MAVKLIKLFLYVALFVSVACMTGEPPTEDTTYVVTTESPITTTFSRALSLENQTAVNVSVGVTLALVTTVLCGCCYFLFWRRRRAVTTIVEDTVVEYDAYTQMPALSSNRRFLWMDAPNDMYFPPQPPI